MRIVFVVVNALLPLCWLAAFAFRRRQRRETREWRAAMLGLTPLHGGRRRRHVFGRTKARGRAPRVTATTARISSYLPPGDPSAARGIRTRLAPPSRPTGLGSTGNVTVMRGADSGQLRRGPAA